MSNKFLRLELQAEYEKLKCTEQKLLWCKTWSMNAKKKVMLNVYKRKTLNEMCGPLTGQTGVRRIRINHKMKKLCQISHSVANIIWKCLEFLAVCDQIGSRVVTITLDSKALCRRKIRRTAVRQLDYL
jgi:hypothetical protein